MNSGNNTHVTETILDKTTVSCFDNCKDSETEVIENIESSGQESTSSVASEEENSWEAIAFLNSALPQKAPPNSG